MSGTFLSLLNLFWNELMHNWFFKLCIFFLFKPLTEENPFVVLSILYYNLYYKTLGLVWGQKKWLRIDSSGKAHSNS